MGKFLLRFFVLIFIVVISSIIWLSLDKKSSTNFFNIFTLSLTLKEDHSFCALKEFDIVKFRHDDMFNLDVPLECPGVPSDILVPKNTWIDKDSYDLSAKKLAQMFTENFTKFNNVLQEIRDAGPQSNNF